MTTQDDGDEVDARLATNIKPVSEEAKNPMHIFEVGCWPGMSMSPSTGEPGDCFTFLSQNKQRSTHEEAQRDACEVGDHHESYVLLNKTVHTYGWASKYQQKGPKCG